MGFWQAFYEGGVRRSAVHVASLVRAFMVVVPEIVVQIGLHLLDRFVPLGASHDPEMLVQQGLVKPFDEPVALGPPDLGGTMLDLFKLQEQLVGMVVRPATEFPAVVAQDGVDPGVVLLKER